MLFDILCGREQSIKVFLKSTTTICNIRCFYKYFYFGQLKPIHSNGTEFKNGKIDDMGVLEEDISLLNANDHLRMYTYWMGM